MLIKIKKIEKTDQRNEGANDIDVDQCREHAGVERHHGHLICFRIQCEHLGYPLLQSHCAQSAHGIE